MMKTLSTLLVVTFALLPALTLAQDGQVQLRDSSKLSIKGKSNVNEFSCESEHELQKDSLDYSYSVNGDTVQVSGVNLNLEIDQFDCGKRAINRDFKSTLKYKEFPFIEIILNELVVSDSTSLIPREAKVTIRIAGTERYYTVPLNSFSSSEESFTVGGNKILRMTDFGLEPPSPMFGLIKVEDELDIQFDLVIVRSPFAN
ncbi:YceI family protein [Gracilimonas amylolytica]|jgi:hypothetical protein|uniref:YceI family protein n=1 Tax=Gracilimonas amylolytica TaxID=1749045 RepID=UPI0012FFE95D|nr:YceI family protein [Gracilimonas amylolytica]